MSDFATLLKNINSTLGGSTPTSDDMSTLLTTINTSLAAFVSTPPAFTVLDALSFHWTGKGSGNEAFGSGALLLSNTGGQNVAFGTNALRENASGSDNVAIGWEALANNTSGGSNTAIGGQALEGCTDGFNNTAIGNNVLKSLTSGENNIVVGIDSGYAPQNNTAWATVIGTGNTFVGFQAGAGSSADPSYTLALGHFATTIGNGSVAMGTDHTGNGAASTAQDQIVLGTSLHTTRVPGLPAFVAGDKPCSHHDCRGASRQRGTRRGGIGDPARGQQGQPDGCAYLGQQRQQTDDALHMPARLNSLHDQRVGARVRRGSGRVRRGDLHQHACAAGTGASDQLRTEPEGERHDWRALFENHLEPFVLLEVEHQVHAERAIRKARERADLFAQDLRLSPRRAQRPHASRS